jgi:salicylate hydroxylase
MESQPNNLKAIGRSIYRCLIPAHKVMSDPEVKALYEGQLPGFLAIRDPVEDTFIMSFFCRDAEVLNCAIVHNSKTQQSEHEDVSWNQPVSYAEIVATLHRFHPTAKKILTLASEAESDFKVHHLMTREPMSSFIRGRAVAIGDAAHVMLPTHAAGAAITIESAACLGVLFDKSNMPIDSGAIENRLALFDKLRLGRCNMAMILSNAGFGGLAGPGVEEKVRRYYDGPLPPLGSIPFSTKSNKIFFDYNIIEETRKLLRKEE